MTETQEIGSVSTRPVVRFGGQPRDEVQQCLVSVSLEEARGGLSSLELRLRNRRGVRSGDAESPFDSDQVVNLGAEIDLGMGDEARPGSMFKGTVTSIEELYDRDGPPQLIVLAEDALQKARMARRSKVWDDFRISDFAQALAQDLGLQPRVNGLQDSLGVQVQLNESDLAFLRRLLRDHHAEVQIIEGELHVRALADVRRGQIDLAINRELVRCRINADLAHQITEATAAGWDAEQGSRFGVTSQVSDLGPGTGRNGASWLTQALRARNEHVSHVPVRTEDEARALANTTHAMRARSFVRVDATAFGDPRIRVGSHVNITGVAARFANVYVVTRAIHRFDRLEGYKTDFEAECAYMKEGS